MTVCRRFDVVLALLLFLAVFSSATPTHRGSKQLFQESVNDNLLEAVDGSGDGSGHGGLPDSQEEPTIDQLDAKNGTSVGVKKVPMIEEVESGSGEEEKVPEKEEKYVYLVTIEYNADGTVKKYENISVPFSKLNLMKNQMEHPFSVKLQPEDGSFALPEQVFVRTQSNINPKESVKETVGTAETVVSMVPVIGKAVELEQTKKVTVEVKEDGTNSTRVIEAESSLKIEEHSLAGANNTVASAAAPAADNEIAQPSVPADDSKTGIANETVSSVAENEANASNSTSEAAGANGAEVAKEGVALAPGASADSKTPLNPPSSSNSTANEGEKDEAPAAETEVNAAPLEKSSPEAEAVAKEATEGAAGEKSESEQHTAESEEASKSKAILEESRPEQTNASDNSTKEVVPANTAEIDSSSSPAASEKVTESELEKTETQDASNSTKPNSPSEAEAVPVEALAANSSSPVNGVDSQPSAAEAPEVKAESKVENLHEVSSAKVEIAKPDEKKLENKEIGGNDTKLEEKPAADNSVVASANETSPEIPLAAPETPLAAPETIKVENKENAGNDTKLEEKPAADNSVIASANETSPEIPLAAPETVKVENKENAGNDTKLEEKPAADNSVVASANETSPEIPLAASEAIKVENKEIGGSDTKLEEKPAADNSLVASANETSPEIPLAAPEVVKVDSEAILNKTADVIAEPEQAASSAAKNASAEPANSATPAQSPVEQSVETNAALSPVKEATQQLEKETPAAAGVAEVPASDKKTEDSNATSIIGEKENAKPEETVVHEASNSANSSLSAPVKNAASAESAEDESLAEKTASASSSTGNSSSAEQPVAAKVPAQVPAADGEDNSEKNKEASKGNAEAEAVAAATAEAMAGMANAESFNTNDSLVAASSPSEKKSVDLSSLNANDTALQTLGKSNDTALQAPQDTNNTVAESEHAPKEANIKNTVEESAANSTAPKSAPELAPTVNDNDFALQEILARGEGNATIGNNNSTESEESSGSLAKIAPAVDAATQKAKEEAPVDSAIPTDKQKELIEDSASDNNSTSDNSTAPATTTAPLNEVTEAETEEVEGFSIQFTTGQPKKFVDLLKAAPIVESEARHCSPMPCCVLETDIPDVAWASPAAKQPSQSAAVPVGSPFYPDGTLLMVNLAKCFPLSIVDQRGVCTEVAYGGMYPFRCVRGFFRHGLFAGSSVASIHCGACLI